MNELQIASIVVGMICVVICTILAWVTLTKTTRTEVSFTGTPVDKKEFEKHVAENAHVHENIFSRIGGAERGVETRINARLETISNNVVGLSQKMQDDKTEILERGEERTAVMHERINELVGAVGRLQGRIEKRLNE